MMTDEVFSDLVDGIVKNYKGDISVLGNALGVLLISRYMGWKVVYIVYSPKTLIKYQNAIGVKIKVLFSEESRYSDKSLGLRAVKLASNFWNIVKGVDKIPKNERIMMK